MLYIHSYCGFLNHPPATTPPYLGCRQILVKPYLFINKGWFCSNEWGEVELWMKDSNGVVREGYLRNFCFHREFRSPASVLAHSGFITGSQQTETDESRNPLFRHCSRVGITEPRLYHCAWALGLARTSAHMLLLLPMISMMMMMPWLQLLW